MFECHLCSDTFKVDSVNELEAHLAADHFNCLPYWCDHCQFTRLPTEFTLCNHYEKVHGLSEYNIHHRFSREIFLKQQSIKSALKYAIENKQFSNKNRTASVSDLEQKNSPSQVSVDSNFAAADKPNSVTESYQNSVAKCTSKAPSIEVISIDHEEEEPSTPNPFINETGQAFNFTGDFHPTTSSLSRKAPVTSTPLPIATQGSYGLKGMLNEVFFGEERAQQSHSAGYSQPIEFGQPLSYHQPSNSFVTRSKLSPEKASSSSIALLNRCSEVIKEGAINRFTEAMSKREDEVKSENVTESYSLHDFYIDGSAVTDLSAAVSGLSAPESLQRPGPIIREESPPRRRNPKPAFEKGVLYQCLKCSSRVTGPCIIKHINYKWLTDKVPLGGKSKKETKTCLSKSQFSPPWDRHVKLPFFRCRACNKKSCQTAITSIASHIKLLHNGDMSLLESRYKECSRQIRAIRGQFFDIYKDFHAA